MRRDQYEVREDDSVVLRGSVSGKGSGNGNTVEDDEESDQADN